MRWLKIAAFVAAGIYLSVCLAIFAMQRKLAYPAPAVRPWPADAPGVRLRIPSASGDVFAWHVPAAPGQPTAVFFHGNGKDLSYTVPIGAFLHQRGLGFFSIEYPGYFGAPGSPSEQSILAAARAGTDYLRETLQVPASQTVLVGRSLGTGVAAAMAAEGRGGKLVLLSPYTRLPDVGALYYPYLPIHLLMLDHFDTMSRAPSIRVPALVIHGDIDDQIPVEFGRTVAKAIAGSKYVEVHGMGHLDVVTRPEILEQVAAFSR